MALASEARQLILVTGAAGFIGSHVAARLLDDGHRVVGIDNLSPYYDVSLKEARLDRLRPNPLFEFSPIDVADRERVARLFTDNRFDRVIHLAAQAGVRYSLENPAAYIDSNVVGFANVLEGCRHSKVGHLVFASSSSVYGANRKMPFSTHDGVDHPVSLYAATKKSNELLAHTYAHLFGLPVTGLRFFTVYGPWGRPDMSYFLFTRAILEGKPIQVFNGGRMRRDFTYVDDVVEGVVRVMNTLPEPNTDWNAEDPDPPTSYAPYRIYNIGNHQPVQLMAFIEAIESALGKEAVKEMRPLQPGDVVDTYADVSDLQAAIGFVPATPMEEGVRRFVAWYRGFYGDDD